MTIFLTIAVIIEALFIYELWSRLKGTNARMLQLGFGLWVHLRDDHGREADYVLHPEIAEIDRRYPPKHMRDVD
jgi:hypothetical protein